MPIMVLVSSLLSKPTIKEVSFSLRRTVCVTLRLEIVGIPLTLFPERALISNSSCRVTSLVSCNCGVALIFIPMSSYSEPGYGCWLLTPPEMTLTGLMISVTRPAAPEILFVTAISGKLVPGERTRYDGGGIGARGRLQGNREKAAAEVRENRHRARCGVGHRNTPIPLLREIGNRDSVGCGVGSQRRLRRYRKCAVAIPEINRQTVVGLIDDGERRPGAAAETAGGDGYRDPSDGHRGLRKLAEGPVTVALQDGNVLRGLIDDGEVRIAVAIEVRGGNRHGARCRGGQGKRRTCHLLERAVSIPEEYRVRVVLEVRDDETWIGIVIF